MTYKTFNVGDVLTAADVQTIMDQSVIRVETRAERDAIPAKAGMRAYRLDTKRTDRYNGSRWIEGLDWTPLAYETGFTDATAGMLEISVDDGILTLRGGANGAFPASTYTRVTKPGALPDGYRPPRSLRAGAFAQAGRAAGIEITTGGDVLFCQTNSVAPAWIAATVSYAVL